MTTAPRTIMGELSRTKQPKPPNHNRRKGERVNAVRVYLRGVYARARFMWLEAVKGIRVLDWLCIAAALSSLAYMVFNPTQFGLFASEGLAGRAAYQALRGFIIALGVLILVDRRANAPAVKIAVTSVVVGLCANVAENTIGVNPHGIPLKFGYMMVNTGLLIWFLTILFRVPWQQRAERLEAELEDAYAQGYRPRRK